MIDTRAGTGVLDAKPTEKITWSGLWAADANANVSVTMNGSPFASGKGEGVETWIPTVAGVYTFQHTTSGTDEMLTAQFNVMAKDISLANVVVDCGGVTYSGSAFTPPIQSATWGGDALEKGTDYTLSYSDNVNAGMATITLTGTNFYNGTYTTNFTIRSKSLTQVMVASIGNLPYTGAAQTPEPVVMDDARGVTLEKVVDYTLSYANNTAVGEGIVTVTGKGNYTGSINRAFTIEPSEGSELEDVFGGNGQVVADGEGGWMVTITNDIESADLPIEIPDDLGHVTIDLRGHDLIGADGAAGSETTPGGDGKSAIRVVTGDGSGGTVTRLTIITTGGDALVKGGDGGAGNPGGKGAAAIKVVDGARGGVKIDIGAGVTVRGGKGGDSATGEGGDGGSGIEGDVGTNDGAIIGGDGGDSVNGDGGNGGAGVDGNVDVNNGDISGGAGGGSENGGAGDSGEGVTGDVGENNGDVLPYALTDEMVGAVANQPFTGVEVRPAPTVYDGAHDKVLEVGIDYELAWKDNVRPGTATITVTGKGNYRGEVLRSFAIVSPVEFSLKAGEYFKATLEELGYDVPTDGKMPYTVKAFGLPAGLKLMSNKAVKDKKGKITKKANVEWWIEGVPTAALDFFTNPPYLVITVDGDTRTEMLPVDVKEQEVIDLGELELGQSINTNGWLAGVGAGWTVSGLPTGLKYATKKVTKATGSGKKKVTTTVAEAYAVYGKATKAGLFTITVKRKTGAFYETMKYRVLVKPAPVDTALFGEELTNITTMAYVPVEWDLTGDGGHAGRVPLPVVENVAKVAGLPVGLTFAAKNTYAYANAKKKTGKYLKQAGQTIVGTPTKPGTYVVTFTKNVTTGTGKKKKTVAKTAQILWTVTANDANLELGFNTVGGVIEGGTVGLKYGDLMAFDATEGATVTASGMPAGITLANLGGGSYAFTGFTTKAGTYLVTVKATLNGKTVTQRVALKVDGLPSWAKGTFNGYIAGVDGATNGLAAITVSSVGKISGKFYEGGTNWTFTAASYTGYDDAAPAYSVPVVAKYAYKATEIVKGNKKTVTKSVARNFTLRVGQDALGGMATLEEVDGSTVEAWQNLWGSTYKAIGKKLFYTSAKKPYRVFTINGTSDIGMAMGLLPAETLSLKVTTAGAVTATMSFDTGKTSSKGKAVIYKPTCSTVVIPLSAADAEEFEGEVFLFFAPSPANGFPGFAGAAPF